VAVCPSCRRPVAVARASCLYCGETLPPDAVVAPLDSSAAPPGSLEPAIPTEESSSDPRSLVVLDLEGARAETLEDALQLSTYEADLLARRGGYQLHRILEEASAGEEAQRLQEAGLKVEMLPESEVRTRPLRALGGERRRGRLELRTEEDPLTLWRQDVLLVVRGPIARQHQPTYKRRRVEVASPEEGFRVHFHRFSDRRPVEIDASNFAFGFTVTGSTRLEIDAWVEGLGPDVPCDDGFRRLPPAFGIAAPEAKGPLAAAGSLSRSSRARESGGEGESVVLDNARQFLFYSAWRGALERRRAG
jgi:hypothetical protein